jgi:hypothetical protein
MDEALRRIPAKVPAITTTAPRHEHTAAAGLNHRPVLLSVGTDVSLSGEPAAEWLVVTPDHLAATDGHGTLRAVPWRGVERVRTTSGVGGGSLMNAPDVVKKVQRLAGIDLRHALGGGEQVEDRDELRVLSED